jgi:hypothetical protein
MFLYMHIMYFAPLLFFISLPHVFKQFVMGFNIPFSCVHIECFHHAPVTFPSSDISDLFYLLKVCSYFSESCLKHFWEVKNVQTIA